MYRSAASLSVVLTFAITTMSLAAGCSSPPPPEFSEAAPTSAEEFRSELLTVVTSLRERIESSGLMSLRNSADTYRTRLQQFDITLLGDKAMDGKKILDRIEQLFAKATSMSQGDLVEQLKQIESDVAGL